MDKKPIEQPESLPAPQPIEAVPSGLTVKRRFFSKKLLLWAGGIVLALIIGVGLAGFLWYQTQLSPVSDNPNELIAVTIEPDTAPADIATQLEDQGVIRSDLAFRVYIRLSGTQDTLQAGSYRLSPGDSTPKIVEHLTNGNVDTFDITFLPGATLADNRKVLVDAGYSEEEVDAALTATYESPLFEDKPKAADLEGYIYGETYRMGSDASVEDILQHTFNTFAQVIEENGLKEKFSAQGLNLYEGIILASIIQRESIGGDEPQIAQVFFLRMEIGMELGSDVTYQYIADKTGVPRDPNLDSPYNTRRYPGLPPGPIAAPGKAALLAVAEPADGDYLYFLSGDDDVTYFGRTLEEHEDNIREHCQEKCQIL
jgi:UPF0755 protein